jgi:hypothetical protein
MFASALSTADHLNVIDPCNRTGKISIPASFVTVTKGVSDYLKHGGTPPPDVKDLSLCLLYQKGRCNAGNRCNQVHAAPEFVSQIRARSLSACSCCAAHGDVHSRDLQAGSRHVLVTKDGEHTLYSLADFAMTPSLETAMTRARSGPIRVQATRLCRLHLKGGCKFGRDCKNVHLCPNAKPLPQVQPMVHAEPVAAPPSLGLAFRAVDTCASVHTAPSGAYLPGDISTNTSVSDIADSIVDTASRTTVPAAAADVTPMSVLSIMSEFNSIRREADDPLDIMDDDSNGSVVSSIDFGAFVDGLVQCGQVEPMASPQWIAA